MFVRSSVRSSVRPVLVCLELLFSSFGIRFFRMTSGQSQDSLRTVSGQSQVSLRSVSGQSQVSLRSVTGTGQS